MFECSRCGYRRAAAGLVFIVALTVSAFGGTFLEDFTSEPLAGSWRVHGNSNLFAWDEASGELRVTWDSAQPNSYFYRPLGTVLTRHDDFSLEFDLLLEDIATGAKSGPFEIAVGFVNLSDATQPGFWRGTGVNAAHGPRNLVEFDYFPAGYYPGWGDVLPSISPTLVSRDNQFASAFTLLELTNRAVYRVTLAFTSTNQTLHTTVTVGGSAFGTVDDAVLGTNFSDFRVDTIAIASYSDTGNDYDSVLAHGIIDNLKVTIPPPPAAEIAGGFSDGSWQVRFLSQTNWLYTLERTQDFGGWLPVAGSVMGTGALLPLEDRTPPPGGALYRIRAERP